MTRHKRTLFTAFLLFVFGGYAVSFISKKKPHIQWSPVESGISLSTHSLQETLYFLEVTNTKNTLHPDWYALIDPITYVVTNGIIKSITGYLLLDLTRPVDFSLSWKNEHRQKYPTLLLVLPSHQGIQAAQNLARNLKNWGTIKENNLEWKGVFQFPSFPTTTLFWEGKNKHLLLVWTLETNEEPFPNSLFYVTDEHDTKETIASWNNAYIPQNPFFLKKEVPMETFELRSTWSEKKITFSGEGVWKGQENSKASLPPTLIAGWNLMGVPPLQVHKRPNQEICIAGEHPIIRQALNISKKCTVVPIEGWFFLSSPALFQYIDLPPLDITIDIWSTKTTIWMEGILEKKEERALFPLYIWLYQKISKMYIIPSGQHQSLLESSE